MEAIYNKKCVPRNPSSPLPEIPTHNVCAISNPFRCSGMNDMKLHEKNCMESRAIDGKTVLFLSRRTGTSTGNSTVGSPTVHRTNRTGVPHPLAVGISDHSLYFLNLTKEAIYLIRRATCARPKDMICQTNPFYCTMKNEKQLQRKTCLEPIAHRAGVLRKMHTKTGRETRPVEIAV